MIALILAAALSVVDVPTTTPGAQVCTPMSVAAGDYYIRATATDSDGNESGASNQVLKALPDDVCWTNPTENVDGSALTDLVLVTVYWSTDPIVPGGGPPVVGITLDVDCAALTCQLATVVAGETGQPLQVTWDTTDGPFTARVFEWPDGAIPLAQASTITGNSFTWTPTKAGIYFLTVEGQTLTSETTHVFYIKLAAPTGGGID